MRKTVLWVIAGAIVLGLAGAAAFWYAVLRPALGASGTATAVPLPASIAAAGAPTETAAAGGEIIFHIDQAKTQARFEIDEVLRGQPNHVEGVTDQVVGEIAFDPQDLASAQVGTISINARTFVTDEDRRNQAIRNFILHTNPYEFITYTPSEILGLSGSAAPGDMLEFQVSGDLTIQDITQRVIFDVAATFESPTTLSGTATATIQRSDFGITIPNVPFVANVGQEVTLVLEFVAAAGES